MKKPVYLDLPIVEISKLVIYEIWCDYGKPKYIEEAKLCYMNTDSIIVFD